MTGPNLHLNNSMGSLFIGVLFAIILYGLGCAQFVYYARSYARDPIPTKTLVTVLWLLDTTRTIMDIVVVWQYLVTNHATPTALFTLVNSFYAEFFLNSLTVLIVQTYFIHSIWRLLSDGKKWFRVPLTVAALSLALLSFGGGCGTIYKASLNHALTVVFHNVTVPACIATVTAVVADIYITVSLCLILSAGRTGFGRTEYFIAALTGYAIRRGFFTALVQALHFLTYIATLKQNSLYWMIFHFPASKVYVNALLAVLNVRNTIRERAMPKPYNANDASVELGSIPDKTGSQPSAAATNRSGSFGTVPAPAPAGITYTREVIRDR